MHNGIEYGIMQSYAAGYELLAAQDIIKDVPGTFAALRNQFGGHAAKRPRD